MTMPSNPKQSILLIASFFFLLVQEGHLFASNERKKCALSIGNKSLGGFFKNSVAKITDRPDMTIAVNRGVKAHKAVLAKFPS